MQGSKSLLVVGGTSDIGRATALCYAQAGWRILLAARDLDAVKRNADDIVTRTGASVSLHGLDILDTDKFATFVDELPVLPDTVVCAVGLLGDQCRAQIDLDHATTILRTNFEGPALLLGLMADRLAARGSGAIVGVSSIAGDRGRASNYVYGSAKSGFTAFLSGLRSRFARDSRIHVLTVKPGFVRTRMTADMRLLKLLTAEPAEVGSAIFRAAEGPRRDIVYVRAVWRPLMKTIVVLPERIFKRLRL